MANEATKLILPTEATMPERDWINQRIVVVGAPGIGKSGLFANGDKTLFFDTEGNLAHLKVKRLACRSWDDAREIYGALFGAMKNGAGFPYDTVIIDTVDKLVDYAEQNVVDWARDKYKKAAENINTVGDVPEGAGWSRLSKSVMSFLESVDSLPCAVVVITHPKTIKVENPSGANYDKEGLALFPSIANKLLGWSHHTLHIQASWVGKDLNRVVRTMPDKGIEAKSHGGVIPDKWEWKTRELAEEYRYLRGLFT